MTELKVKEAPVCSHCNETMTRQDLPPVSFSDGLGWGTTFLWICANDDCPIFRKGFYHTMENYGQASSLRSIIEPDSGHASVIPAATLDPEHFKAFAELRKKRLSEKMDNEPDEIDIAEEAEWEKEAD